MRAYRRAMIGLGLVIVGLAGSSVFSAVRTNVATRRTAQATVISDVYQRAFYSVGAEESLERKYRLEPSAEVRRRHAAAAAALVTAMNEIREIGTARDRKLASDLLSTHARYLEGITTMFDAVDEGNNALVLEIEAHRVDPLFATVEATVDTASRSHLQAALARLNALRQTENLVLRLIPLVFVIGIALLTVVAVALNRTLRRQAEASEHSALHDALTGLPNRLLFRDRLEHAIRMASRDPAPFSVLMIDLDRFKEINDTLGHTTGDLLLGEIGPRINSVVRPTDTVARLGGDEFGVLLAGADSETARTIAERINAALLEPFTLTGLAVAVGGSIGIVTYPTHANTADELLQHADVAMYLAKGQGRGKALYDPGADPYDPARLTLAGDLRRAVAADEFELHYQPKLATDTLQLEGVEALVRWRHPERGLLPPSDFIPLAEHTGQIKQLTLCVLRQAARQHLAWREQGMELKIAVNLSVANLLDLELVQDIRAVLGDEPISPWLELEITESTVMADPDRALQILSRLAAMGIDLAIDDFGTGHSSLAYLRKLPVGQLKIDRSFITHLAVDDKNAEIVRSTIELGHTLGLKIVAEGIEDPKALSILRELGCDTAQGFYLCRPAPADVVFEHLRQFQSSCAGTDALAA